MLGVVGQCHHWPPLGNAGMAHTFISVSAFFGNMLETLGILFLLIRGNLRWEKLWVLFNHVVLSGMNTSSRSRTLYPHMLWSYWLSWLSTTQLLPGAVTSDFHFFVFQRYIVQLRAVVETDLPKFLILLIPTRWEWKTHRILYKTLLGYNLPRVNTSR